MHPDPFYEAGVAVKHACHRAKRKPKKGAAKSGVYGTAFGCVPLLPPARRCARSEAAPGGTRGGPGMRLRLRALARGGAGYFWMEGRRASASWGVLEPCRRAELMRRRTVFLRECDSPLRLTNFTLDYLAKNWAAEIDFVVWTGDNARYAPRLTSSGRSAL